MKKVEVYFLINLGAILSLFAIEGELARYMSRQDDILKNVAQDKLQDLVEISNVESNYEDPDYFRLDIAPQEYKDKNFDLKVLRQDVDKFIDADDEKIRQRQK